MLEHVYTNPSPKCRKEAYHANSEAKVLAPQMPAGTGQFIVFTFAIERFISVFP